MKNKLLVLTLMIVLISVSVNAVTIPDFTSKGNPGIVTGFANNMYHYDGDDAHNTSSVTASFPMGSDNFSLFQIYNTSGYSGDVDLMGWGDTTGTYSCVRLTLFDGNFLFAYCGSSASWAVAETGGDGDYYVMRRNGTDSNNFELIFNGVNEGVGGGTNTVNILVGKGFGIAYRPYNNDKYFTGGVDTTAVFNISLSDNQVAMMNKTTTCKQIYSAIGSDYIVGCWDSENTSAYVHITAPSDIPNNQSILLTNVTNVSVAPTTAVILGQANVTSNASVKVNGLEFTNITFTKDFRVPLTGLSPSTAYDGNLTVYAADNQTTFANVSISFTTGDLGTNQSILLENVTNVSVTGTTAVILGDTNVTGNFSVRINGLEFVNATFTKQGRVPVTGLTVGTTYSGNLTVYASDNQSVFTNVSLSFATNAAPIMQSVNITPNPYAYISQTLQGFCNASDNDGDNVTYNSIWYLNNTLNTTKGIVWADIYNYTGIPITNKDYAFDKDMSTFARVTHDAGQQDNFFFIYNFTNSSWVNASTLYIRIKGSTLNNTGGTLEATRLDFWNFTDNNYTNSFQHGIKSDVPATNCSGELCADYDKTYEVPPNFIGPQGYVFVRVVLSTKVSPPTNGTLNGVYLSTELTTETHTQDTVVNYDNISGFFSADQEWSFSCRAFNGELYSNYLNSSITRILPNAPAFTYIDVDTGLTTLTLSMDTKDSVNITINGSINYKNTSYNQNKSFNFGSLDPHSIHTLNITICNQINNCSSLGTTGLTKTRINITAWERISWKNISGFLTNITYLNTNQSNTTTTGLISFIVGNDTHVDYRIIGFINATATNYLNSNTTTFNISATTGVYLNTSFYSSILNITANTSADGSQILTFNITTTGLNYTYTQTKATTTGYVGIELVNSSYNITITSTGFATNLTRFDILGESYYNYTFFLPAGESISLTIYDEKLNTLLTWRNVTIEFSNTARGFNISVGDGSEFISGLETGEWKLNYFADDYEPRFYYFSVSNGSNENAKLYLLNDTIADQFTLEVLDENDLPVEGALVQLLRYFITSNSYDVVEMGKTNSEGKTPLWVELFDADYQFIIKSNITSGILKLEQGQKLTSSTLRLGVELQGASLSTYWASTTTSSILIFDNTTKTFRYTWSDSNGFARTHCLEVTRETAAASEIICDTCNTAAASTLICDLSSYENSTGIFYAVGRMDSNSENSWVDEARAAWSFVSSIGVFGALGVLLSILIILIVGFASSWNPYVMILGSTIGLVTVFTMGLFWTGTGIVFLMGVIFSGMAILITGKTA